MSKPIKLIVGLRNPGPAYQATRHNVGEWFVNAVAADLNLTLRPERKLQGSLANFSLAGHSSALFLPSTFMNCSGQAMRAVCNFYKLSIDEVLVVHDDLDLPSGVAKLKFAGGHGGHNGLRDIFSHMHSKDFSRLRIGIGHPGQRELVVDYVLGKPSVADKQKINNSIADSLQVLEPLLAGDMANAMQRLHS